MCFITLKKEQNNCNKCFASSAAFALIFHFKLCSFCWWGAQECFWAKYPSYATA